MGFTKQIKKSADQAAMLSDETKAALAMTKKLFGTSNYRQLCDDLNKKMIAEIGKENCSHILLSGE